MPAARIRTREGGEVLRGGRLRWTVDGLRGAQLPLLLVCVYQSTSRSLHVGTSIESTSRSLHVGASIESTSRSLHVGVSIESTSRKEACVLLPVFTRRVGWTYASPPSPPSGAKAVHMRMHSHGPSLRGATPALVQLHAHKVECAHRRCTSTSPERAARLVDAAILGRQPRHVSVAAAVAEARLPARR